MSDPATHLPAEFEELERFCPEWLIDSEQDRYTFRVNRTIEELDAFYEAVFPRLDDIADYIDRYTLDAMSQEAVHLLRLGQMVMEVSPAVIVYRQPDVPNATPFERFRVISPDAPIQIVE